MVGGTATTLAMMDGGIDLRHPELIHQRILKKNRLQQLLQKMRETPLAERRAWKGLHPDRADVIVAGALIVQTILDYFELNSAMISMRDLLYGVWLV